MHRSLSFLVLICLSYSAIGRSEETLSFNRDIRPILSDKCFACHGPDQNTREADLRLDVRKEAIAMEAIIPGDLKASEVYWRMVTDDESEVMPPPKTHKALTDDEKRILSKWIEQGAKYEAHWAYLPVEKPDIKEGENLHPIDQIVLERLSAEGLKLSEKADEVTLLRRLHFDITGLPPRPEDLDDFRRLGMAGYVDQLLESPHFGERMAIEWLDAVRYADTVGYHGDQNVEVSAYRDWVIRSFNQGKTFDQFTIEQIAGDLLPDATLEQKVAASYHRLGQSSQEGGIQDAEYLAKYQAERVRTTATAWLGATLACAECHDHKFDPYTTKDFYAFAAYFADILEKGAWTGDGSYQEDIKPYQQAGIAFGSRGPQLSVPTEEEEARRKALEQQVAEAKSKLQEPRPELTGAALKWAEEWRGKKLAEGSFDYVYLAEKGEKNGVDTKGWKFVTAKDGKVHQGNVARLQKAGGLIQHIGKSSNKPLLISEGDRLFSYVWLDPKNPPKQVMLQFHHSATSWSHRAWWGEDVIPYGQGSQGPDHHRAGDLPEAGKWVRLEVPISAVGLAPGDKVTQLAFTQHGGSIFWDSAGVHTKSEQYRNEIVPKVLRELTTAPGQPLSEAEKAKVVAAYRAIAPELESERSKLTQLEGQLAAAVKGVRTIPATVSAKPREIRILPRGNWMDRTGEVVTPGTPHFLPGYEERDASGNRLELAQWLVSPENPLTARTFVNRLWARFFGTGISGVVDDLGSQGEWPTHPALLDWLAADFVESGWDVKQLVKTIVLTQTYAQSSESSSELDEKDPYNRLLARQSGLRLPAELVRDNVLTVAGLLNPKIGGRSVRPYQPSGYYQHLNFPRRTYQADKDENQYRRGLYTHWQRTFLHPAMKAFDAPSREECTMERDASSTPLQALVLMNDPSFVEAAKVLAGQQGGISELFREALTRSPSPDELYILEELFEAERKRLHENPEAASQLLGVGLKQVEFDDSIELAARTAVARAILNLKETITRY